METNIPPSTWLSGGVVCVGWSGCIIKNTYPSHIFLTLVLSWSPWKKIMKTVLFTSSPCKHMVAPLDSCLHNLPFLSPLMTCRYSSQRPSNAKIWWLSVSHKFVPKGPTGNDPVLVGQNIFISPHIGANHTIMIPSYASQYWVVMRWTTKRQGPVY